MMILLKMVNSCDETINHQRQEDRSLDQHSRVTGRSEDLLELSIFFRRRLSQPGRAQGPQHSVLKAIVCEPSPHWI